MSDVLEKLQANMNNGAVRIPRQGMVEFCFGDDPKFKLDVMDTWDQWYVVDHASRNEKGVIPDDQFIGYQQQKKAFFQSIVTRAYQEQIKDVQPPCLTGAESEMFKANLEAEVKKLQNFFAPRLPEPPSSPSSSDVRFSQ